MKKGGVVVLFVVLLVVVGAGGYYYFYKKNEVGEQLAKISNQLSELPSLEKDIFAKCMEGKNGTAQDIAFCQENTQKQMSTLAQDLMSAKKELESKSLVEVLQS